MVCNSAEDLPCCSEGHSHASGGGKKHSDINHAHTHMVTSTLCSVVLQTEMPEHTRDALKAWVLTALCHIRLHIAFSLKLGHSHLQALC